MKIRKVAEGAYFVSSYSEQTVLPFQSIITTQTVTAKEPEEAVFDAIEEKDLFMDKERQKLELDITQEFEVADGVATLLINETR
jgi:hypothetical protein